MGPRDRGVVARPYAGEFVAGACGGAARLQRFAARAIMTRTY